MKAQIVTIPKRCRHGAVLRWHRRFGGAIYTTTDCAECRAEEQARMDADDAETGAMCEGIKARREEEP